MDIDWLHRDSVTSVNFESAVYRIPDKNEAPPTRVCSICDKPENPKATIADDSGWLCPECKKRLTQMLYPKEGE